MESSFISGLEQVMHYITLPGAAALFCVVIFMLLSRKRGRLLMLSLSAAISLSVLLKALFKIPRPWLMHPETAPLHAEGGYALPCLHTQLTAAVLCAFALSSKKRSVRFLCAAGICLTGAVRCMSGLQSVPDVLTAAAAGILCAALLTHFVYYGNGSGSRMAAVWITAVLGAASALLSGDGWGLGLTLAVLLLTALEKVFCRADNGRTRFGELYGTALAAGIYAGLYVFLPFLIEWLLTPRWPGQILIVFLISFLPCLLQVFPLF